MKARIFAEENRKWWTLAAVSFGLFMIMLDNTVVNVALPSIQRRPAHLDLASSSGSSRLRAVVRGAADHGRQARRHARAAARSSSSASRSSRSSSLACGLAPSAGFLIGARAVQGIGAALMNPATLSIITATFPPRQRGQAIGIWAGVSALALAIGPLVGGLIVDNINWNWIFFVNVPVGVLGIVVSQLRDPRVARHLARAEHRPAGARHLGARRSSR